MFFFIFFLLKSPKEEKLWCRQEVEKKVEPQSHLLDLLDVNLGAQGAAASTDPWGMPQSQQQQPLARQVYIEV